MAANFSSRTTLRIVAVMSPLPVLAFAWWLTFAKADVEQRTVVRLTHPMATGDYLTGDDIEAVGITLSASDAAQYVTTRQAADGLIAARDLAVGDVLVVADVYTTRSDRSDVQGTTTESGNGQEVGILAASIGMLGVVAIGAHLARRRPRQRVATMPPNFDATPLTRQWVHLEVNAWVGGEARGTARPETSTAGSAAVGSVDGMASVAGIHVAAPDQHGAAGDTGAAPTLLVNQEMRDEATVTLQLEDPMTALIAVDPVHVDVPVETTNGQLIAQRDEPETSRPLAVLQVLGEVKVLGVPVSQAIAAPFLLAAAGRPMSSNELVQLTGYAAKTFSSVYPASHPLIARTNGMLTLADGVWTDHAWLAETVRRAANAVRDDHHADAAEWLRYSLELAGQIDGAPYERLPRSRRNGGPGPRLDQWSWTDDFPYTVSARAHAGQEAVEAVLAAAELWLVAGRDDVLPSALMVELLCRLARILPHVPVTRNVRPSQWQSGAQCLLLAAREIANTQDQINHVHTTARRLVADELIEPDVGLADDLGL